MNYSEVYFSRVFHLGENTNQIAQNSNIRSFERWLANSPFTVDNLSVERGLYFSGIIQTSKDKEEKKLMYLYVSLDIPIKVGDILTWIQDDGTIEKWLLLQKVHGVHDAYQTFQMIKCNYQIKWIDTEGYLHKTWAYAVSSVDSKIKGNFRMWHSLISPQPNKFAEIIIPRPDLKPDSEDINELMRGITFILENEAWVVIECDWTSVEGITYMSLTESKVNYHYDDRNIDVADTDRYKFPILPLLYKVGEVIIPHFEADTLNQWEIELRPSDFSLFSEVKEQEGEKEKWFSELHSYAAGTCIITMRIKNRPAVTQNIEITINPTNEEFIAFIEGPDKLKLDRYDTYKLSSEQWFDESKVSIIIQDDPKAKEENKPSEYAKLIQAIDDNGDPVNNKYILRANKKNKLGKLVLVATYEDKVYTKTVEVIPLW